MERVDLVTRAEQEGLCKGINFSHPIAICDAVVAIKPPISFSDQEEGIRRVAIVGHVGQANVLEAMQLLCVTMSCVKHFCCGLHLFLI